MSPPHLYCLLRGQQLLLLFSDLEDEAWIALQRLVIPRKSGRRLPAPSAVGSSLAEAWMSDPTVPLLYLWPGLPSSPSLRLPNPQGHCHPSLCGEVTKPAEYELTALPELFSSQGWGTISSSLLGQT